MYLVIDTQLNTVPECQASAKTSVTDILIGEKEKGTNKSNGKKEADSLLHNI